MRAGGGKAKGSAFERQICKELSLWVSGGKQKDIFWRSAMSGGRSTVAMKKGDKLAVQAGDVSSIHILGHKFIDEFTVECKFYKTLNYESIIKGKGKLLDFWRIAFKDAEKYGKMPLLVAKQNNYPTVACMTVEGARRLGMYDLIKMQVNDCEMVIVLWENFLDRDPRVLRRVRL